MHPRNFFCWLLFFSMWRVITSIFQHRLIFNNVTTIYAIKLDIILQQTNVFKNQHFRNNLSIFNIVPYLRTDDRNETSLKKRKKKHTHIELNVTTSKTIPSYIRQKRKKTFKKFSYILERNLYQPHLTRIHHFQIPPLQ